MNRRDFFKALAALGGAALIDPHAMARAAQLGNAPFNGLELRTLREFFALTGSPIEDRDMRTRSDTAQLVLAEIQDDLPQFGVFDENGFHPGRQKFSEAVRDIHLPRSFLFTINWADTGPGISWPESYHATYIPRLSASEGPRVVVTASQDSPDMWGVTELAVGWFSADTDLMAGCQKVLTRWWDAQYAGWEQDRWAYVWDEGEVTCDVADEWATSVWNENAGKI